MRENDQCGKQESNVWIIVHENKRINKRQALIKESQRGGDLAQKGTEKGFMTLEFIF